MDGRLAAQGREDVVGEAPTEDPGVGEVDIAHDGIVTRGGRRLPIFVTWPVGAKRTA